MEQEKPQGGKQYSADWFFKGILARLGETVDKFAGRTWESTSSLAVSGLVERLKPLLEQEKVYVEGKGYVVPHSIKLKMQWDKFSADGETSLDGLTQSLAIAAIDHINDSLYYTYAPVKVEVNTDYFTEGVKLTASFEQFAGEVFDAEHNVTMPNIVIPPPSVTDERQDPRRSVSASFKVNGLEMRKELLMEPGRSVSVGRTGSNQLVLDDASVSKVHASLVCNADGSLSVADTGSTNGTLVNGERIAYGKSVAIAANSTVTFGTVDVRFDVMEQDLQTADEPRKSLGDLRYEDETDETEQS